MEALPEEVLRALVAKQAPQLVGLVESPTVDFKAEPYQTTTARQKQELAKDAAAFANAGGGVIVLGFKTTKSGVVAADVVTEARPFPLEQFHDETWMKLINDWVYPVIEGLGCQWFPTDEPERGFAVIKIPEQAVTRKPFLVTRTSFDETKTEGAIFGLFERRRADSEPVSVYEVQARLRDGDLLRRVFELRDDPGAIDRLSLTSPTKQRAASPTVSLPPLRERIAALVAAAELSGAPTYVLAAVPTPGLSGRELFGTHAREVADMLWHPPKIRSMGFDLDTGSQAEIIEGRARRSVAPHFKALELWRDGVLLFVATANADFLAWASKEEGGLLCINPLVLAESSLLFAQLAQNTLRLLAPATAKVDFSLHLERLCVGGAPPVLSAGRLGAHVLPWLVKKAPTCDAEFFLTARGGFNPAAVAFALRSEVYHWFGHEDEAIPYASRELPEPSTSVAEIQTH